MCSALEKCIEHRFSDRDWLKVAVSTGTNKARRHYAEAIGLTRKEMAYMGRGLLQAVASKYIVDHQLAGTKHTAFTSAPRLGSYLLGECVPEIIAFNQSQKSILREKELGEMGLALVYAVLADTDYEYLTRYLQRRYFDKISTLVLD